MIAAPLGVMTLSGWNCTPKVGALSCSTAITSPSAVRALTRRLFGSVASSAASEW